MLKNLYIRLGLISITATLALLIVLPRIPITIKKGPVNIDSYIGGYDVGLFGGKVRFDLTRFRRGLDLAGGVRVVLRADMTKIPESDRKDAMASAVEVVERRINFLGVSEPYIAPSRAGDDYRLIVEIPGVDDPAEAVSLIGQTAQLKFRALAENAPWSEDKFREYYENSSVWVDTGVSGADLKGVDVIVGQGQGPQVRLKFTNEGRQKFLELAKKNVNKPIALFLDKDVVPLSMPVVSENVVDNLVNDPVITGNFDVKTARALSIQLRAGALPVPVEILEQKIVGATLGEASVKESLFAGIVGLLTVLLFMVVSYGRLGIVADVSLVMYSIVVLAIFKLVPVVLTLPGIAGFILSIGMASDANILVFERIKEELGWGKPKSLASEFGFERAWPSIRDSNASSFLTAIVLFSIGTGAVRGFALTLSIGILISLFTSIFVTRTLVDVLGGFGRGKR